MLKPSSKIFLFCSPLIIIGFVSFTIHVGISDLIIQDGDFWSAKNLLISVYSVIFGIILPLTLMICSNGINEAFYRRNPQLKIDIQKREEELKHKGPNDPMENLGWWSIIPIILGVSTYIFLKGNGFLNSASTAQHLVAIVGLPSVYLGAADLFIRFIKIIIGYTGYKALGNSTKSADFWPKDLRVDPDEGVINHSKSNSSNLDNGDRYIGPLKSLELFFKNYSDLSGRSSRSSFLWFQLLDWTVLLTVLELADIMLSNVGYFYHPDYGGLLSISWTVITLVPNISLAVRRLHDTNRSGWWLLLTVTVIGIIPLIIWVCSIGTKGENSYGADKEAGL